MVQKQSNFVVYMDANPRMRALILLSFMIGILAIFWGIGYIASPILVANGVPSVFGWCIIAATSLSLPLTYWVTKGTNRTHGTGIGFLCMLVGQIIYGSLGVIGSSLFGVYFLELMVLNGLLSNMLITTNHAKPKKWMFGLHILLFLAAIVNFYFLSVPVSTILLLCQLPLLLYPLVIKPETADNKTVQ